MFKDRYREELPGNEARDLHRCCTSKRIFDEIRILDWMTQHSPDPIAAKHYVPSPTTPLQSCL